MKKIIILLFIALWMYWSPQYFTFADEGEYMHTAALLSKGIFPPVTDPLFSFKYNTIDKIHFYPQYPLGMGFVFAPVLWLFSWKLLFFIPLLLHLASFFLVSRILRMLAFNEHFALLFLFHPGLVFFSRTLMSETPSVFLVLLATYYYLQAQRDEKKAMYPGIILGISLFFRYTNGIFFLVFFAVSLFQARIRVKSLHFVQDFASLTRAKYLLLGFLPFVILLLVINYQIYGEKFMGYRTSQFTGKAEYAGILPRILLLGKYALPMLLIYPGLLLTAFFYKGTLRKEIMLLLALHGLWFFAVNAQTFHYDFLKNLLLGPRYIYPFYALLLIPYAALLEKMIKISSLHSNLVNAIKSLLIFFLLVSSSIVMAKHYAFTKENYDIMQKIYDITTEDSILYGNSYVLFFTNILFGNRYGIKVYPQRAYEDFRYDYIEKYKEKQQYGIVLSRALDGHSLTGVEGEEKKFYRFPHAIIFNETISTGDQLLIIKLFPAEGNIPEH